ncbi:MAG: hypothetical protein IPF47_21715 [Gemmatimonadetes bacterium]|nr:hypothetical protein [Gemmatimonadota bacterium]
MVDNRRIVWARGYGLRRWGRTTPWTRTRSSGAASISKPVAASGCCGWWRGARARHTGQRLPQELEAPRQPVHPKEKVTLRRIASA